jgi:hypothetical protein
MELPDHVGANLRWREQNADEVTSNLFRKILR